MRLSPRLRNVGLLLHVVVSLGRLGAVFATLGLSIGAMVSDDLEVVRGS